MIGQDLESTDYVQDCRCGDCGATVESWDRKRSSARPRDLPCSFEENRGRESAVVEQELRTILSEIVASNGRNAAVVESEEKSG
jgi:hypothetical protein